MCACVCVCVCARARACVRHSRVRHSVRAFVRAYVRACVRVSVYRRLRHVFPRNVQIVPGIGRISIRPAAADWLNLTD